MSTGSRRALVVGPALALVISLAAACAPGREDRPRAHDGDAAVEGVEGGWNHAGFRLIEGAEVDDALDGEVDGEIDGEVAVWRRLDEHDGRVLDLPAPPARVVSQTLASDEVLLELLPDDRLIAISALALDPRYSLVVEAAARVPETVLHDTERLLSLRPALVVVASYTTPETLRQLDHAGAPVLRLRRFDGIDAIRDNIRTLGFAVGEDAAASTLIAEMDRRITTEQLRVRALLAAAERAAGPGRATEAGAGAGAGASAGASAGAPLRVLSWDAMAAPGAGTIFDDVVRRLGSENPVSAAGLSGWPRVGSEQILAWDPDVIFASAPPGEQEAARRRLVRDPRLALTTAARHGRVHVLDSALASTVSHHVADLVEAIGARLAPPAPDGASRAARAGEGSR